MLSRNLHLKNLKKTHRFIVSDLSLLCDYLLPPTLFHISVKLQIVLQVCSVSSERREHLKKRVLLELHQCWGAAPKQTFNHKCYHLVECIFWLGFPDHINSHMWPRIVCTTFSDCSSRPNKKKPKDKINSQPLISLIILDLFLHQMWNLTFVDDISTTGSKLDDIYSLLQFHYYSHLLIIIKSNNHHSFQISWL